MSNNKRFNKYQNKIIHLEKGEEFCPKCNGAGETLMKRYDRMSKFLKCRVCNGKGKIDWIERAVRQQTR